MKVGVKFRTGGFEYDFIPPCLCKKEPEKGVPRSVPSGNQGLPSDPAAFTRHLTGS